MSSASSSSLSSSSISHLLPTEPTTTAQTRSHSKKSPNTINLLSTTILPPEPSTTQPPKKILPKKSLKRRNAEIESVPSSNSSTDSHIPIPNNSNSNSVTRISSISSNVLAPDPDEEDEKDSQERREYLLSLIGDSQFDDVIYSDSEAEKSSDSSVRTPKKSNLKTTAKTTPNSNATTSSSMSSSSSSPSPKRTRIVFAPDTKGKGLSQEPNSLDNPTLSLSPYSQNSEFEPIENEVEIKLGEGRRYVGQTLNGVPHGLGREYGIVPNINNDKNWKPREYLIYEGGWENGKWHVIQQEGEETITQPGRLYFPGTTDLKYIGGFKEGEFSGYGISYAAKAKKKGSHQSNSNSSSSSDAPVEEYEGMWKHNEYDGKGIRYSRHGIYKGYWKKGKRQGHGTYNYNKCGLNGGKPGVYTGEFYQNMKHGDGSWYDSYSSRTFVVKYDQDVGIVLKILKINPTTKKVKNIEYLHVEGNPRLLINTWGSMKAE